jgi:hypothetical protein
MIRVIVAMSDECPSMSTYDCRLSAAVQGGRVLCLRAAKGHPENVIGRSPPVRAAGSRERAAHRDHPIGLEAISRAKR